MADKTDDQYARVPGVDASLTGPLQTDTKTRLVEKIAFVGTVVGVLFGGVTEPEHWLQGVILYGFLGFSVGGVLGGMIARRTR